MNVWTVSSNCCGEPRLFGVYQDAEGAYEAAAHISRFADPGDEWRVQYLEVETTDEVKERTEKCRAKHREHLEELASKEAD